MKPIWEAAIGVAIIGGFLAGVGIATTASVRASERNAATATTPVAQPIYGADHDYAIRIETYRDACGWAFTQSPECARRAIEYAQSKREMGK